MSKVLIIVLGVATQVVAGSLILYSNPTHSLLLCSEQTIAEKTSPGGRYVAALMHRSCWGSRNAHINLRLASAPPFPRRSLAGPINDGEIFGTFGVDPSDPRFCWSSPRRLDIDRYRLDPKRGPLMWQDVSIGSDYASCQ